MTKILTANKYINSVVVFVHLYVQWLTTKLDACQDRRHAVPLKDLVSFINKVFFHDMSSTPLQVVDRPISIPMIKNC